MSFTYGGNPSRSNLDAVRFLIQDTVAAKQLVSDEEIEFLLTQEMNIYMAAAAACDALVAAARGIKSKKISEFTIQYDFNFYLRRGFTLKARGMNYQTPYAGGISLADKLALEQDPDWATPSVFRGLEDNQAAPKPSMANPQDPRSTI